MKKLITLILAMAGMVSTASAKTIYVQNNCDWNQICLYMWNSEGHNTWPGTYLYQSSTDKVETVTVGSVKYYKVDLGSTYTSFVLHKFWDKNTEKTNDLSVESDVEDGAFYEFTYDHEDKHSDDNTTKYYRLSKNYFYNFTVKTPSEWTSLYIYLWKKADNTSYTGSFPGTAMTDNGTHKVFDYSIISTESSLGLIFSNVWGDGESNRHQSDNMSALPGNYNYYLTDNGSKVLLNETVTTNSNGYCTYVCANPLTISSATAYYATDDNNGSATAHAITNPAASTPMLIKGDASTTYYFAVASDGTSYSSTNAFKAGDGSTVTGGSGPYNYVLNGDAFYLAKSTGTTVASGKAYLQLSAQAEAGARVLRFADEETQGINAISTFKANDGAYYNLSGQRVVNPTKGLYIKNGKKTIVK